MKRIFTLAFMAVSLTGCMSKTITQNIYRWVSSVGKQQRQPVSWFLEGKFIILKILAVVILPLFLTGLSWAQSGHGFVASGVTFGFPLFTTEVISPGTAAAIPSSPYDDRVWASVDNIKIDDSNLAFSGLYYNEEKTYLLEATNFNFDSIPDGATIVGIVAKIKVEGSTGGTTNITECQLVDNTGTLVGNNNCLNPIPITTNEAISYKYVGSQIDTWDVSLTPAMLKSSSFGIAIGYTSPADGLRNARVYYVGLQVYYYLP